MAFAGTMGRRRTTPGWRRLARRVSNLFRSTPERLALAPGAVRAIDVADAFLARAGERGLTHMAVQKLVILADGVIVARHSQRLIDEAPTMREQGPALVGLAGLLARYGRATIRGPQGGGDAIADRRVTNAVSLVWERYGRLNGCELATLCHSNGSPWMATARENGFLVPEGTPVNDVHTLNHYREIISNE